MAAWISWSCPPGIDLDAESGADEPAKGGGSLLGKFNFKSLVSKKPKEASSQAA
jgi:hypothetical protein